MLLLRLPPDINQWTGWVPIYHHFSDSRYWLGILLRPALRQLYATSLIWASALHYGEDSTFYHMTNNIQSPSYTGVINPSVCYSLVKKHRIGIEPIFRVPTTPMLKERMGISFKPYELNGNTPYLIPHPIRKNQSTIPARTAKGLSCSPWNCIP